jgi:hypothetical protein
MARLISDIRVVVIGTRKVLVKDGTATINVGGEVSTAVMSGFENIGATVQGVPAEISLTCAVEAGTDLASFVVRRTDVRIQTDTGDEWLIRAAFNTDPPSFAGGSGDLSVTYQGKTLIQTKAGS